MEFVSDNNPRKQKNPFSLKSGSVLKTSKGRELALLFAVVALSITVAFQFFRVSSLSTEISNMQSALILLESRTDEVEGAAVGSYTGFSTLNQRVEDLESCVNDYMKTVGDSGGGYYRYYFC
jgi:hypothetical protein